MGSFRPQRALLHPAWLASAAVLVLNDHVLKHLGISPPLVTGKLSDFAGLFVAPALASTFVLARSRRSIALVHALVAVVFALVKTVPFATHAFESLLSLAIPSRVWTDPTDLVALPMVALAFLVLAPSMNDDAAERPRFRKAAQTAACAVGAVMCVATSQAVQAPLSIHNSTKQRLTVTVQHVSDGVRFDEKILQSNTPLPITPGLFAPAGGDATIAVNPSDTQSSSTLGGHFILVGIQSPIGNASFRFAVTGPGQVSAIDIVEGMDGKLSVQTTNGFVRDLDKVSPCAGGPRKGTDYSITLPSQQLGTITLVGFTNGPCFDVSFRDTNLPAHVCMPRDAWPFKEGDTLHVEGADIVGVVGGIEHRLTFVTAPDESKVTVDLSCGAVDTCGTIGFDTTMQLGDGTVVRSGADHTIGDTRFLVGRLESLPVVNTACSDAFGNKQAGRSSSILEIKSALANENDAGSDAGSDASTD